MEQVKSLYEYLEPFLEHGIESEIAAARKQYWNTYKAEWRKQKRKKEKEYTVSFNSKELKIINEAANTHSRSITRFIKEAVIAYVTGNQLATNPASIHAIRELLALNYNELQQLSDEEKIRKDIGRLLMEKFALLELTVLARLHANTVT